MARLQRVRFITLFDAVILGCAPRRPGRFRSFPPRTPSSPRAPACTVLSGGSRALCCGQLTRRNEASGGAARHHLTPLAVGCCAVARATFSASSDFQGTTYSISARNTSRRVRLCLPMASPAPKLSCIVVVDRSSIRFCRPSGELFRASLAKKDAGRAGVEDIGHRLHWDACHAPKGGGSLSTPRNLFPGLRRIASGTQSEALLSSGTAIWKRSSSGHENE